MAVSPPPTRPALDRGDTASPRPWGHGQPSTIGTRPALDHGDTFATTRYAWRPCVVFGVRVSGTLPQRGHPKFPAGRTGHSCGSKPEAHDAYLAARQDLSCYCNLSVPLIDLSGNGQLPTSIAGSFSTLA
jgi:hypothetical protein